MPLSEPYSDANSLHVLFEPLVNDPQKRQETRESFYLKYGYGLSAPRKLAFFFKWLSSLFKGTLASEKEKAKSQLKAEKDLEKRKSIHLYLVHAKGLERIRKHENILERVWLFIKWLFEGEYGFGRSELDFMNWEIKRGALDPSKGSPWWRDVNFLFIVISECAALLIEGKTNVDAVNIYLKTLIDERLEFLRVKTNNFKNEIDKWQDYIIKPSGKAWYRAHNSTIISGYNGYRELAKEEKAAEQHFVNEVLYRLLFAQSMEEGATFLKNMGTLMANPMLPAVEIITAIPAIYPRHYPLKPKDVLNVDHKGKRIGSDLEDELDSVILNNLAAMYTEATGWNRTPELKTYLNKNDKPSYPTDAYLLKLIPHNHA